MWLGWSPLGVQSFVASASRCFFLSYLRRRYKTGMGVVILRVIRITISEYIHIYIYIRQTKESRVRKELSNVTRLLYVTWIEK